MGTEILRSPKITLDVLAASIVEDLQTALEQFMAISEDISGGISVSDT
jgi:hypothetical protein